MKGIVGQSALFYRLFQALKTGQSAHSVLFTGVQGVGKRTIMRACAQTLHCTALPEQKPCGTCAACRRFLGGNHPDDFILATEKLSIGVDAVRELIQALASRPYEGKLYTVRIERADMMTHQAQNALLKSMEEPTGEVVFFLSADVPMNLLSTVRSRCLAIPIVPVSSQAVAQALVHLGASPEEASSIGAVSGGIYGKALSLYQDAKLKEVRGQAIEALLGTHNRETLAVNATGIGALKAHSAWILEVWELVLRDMLMLRLNVPVELYTSDEAERMGRRSMDFTVGKLSDMMEAIRNARKRIHANVSWAHASEALLLSWMEGMHSW